MNITEVLQNYARIHRLEHSNHGWEHKTIQHAAKYFYYPGKKQHTPPDYATEAITEAKAALHNNSSAPEWIKKALKCSERHPPN